MKIIYLVLSLMILLFLACEEYEVFPLTNSDEIERYIEESYIGESLFKPAVFGQVKEYTFDGNDTSYTETIDSTKRSVEVFISSDTVIFSFGSYKYAQAVVTDKLYGRSVKTIGAETFTNNFFKRFHRYGYFVKIGDNDQKYSGWVLYGLQSGYTTNAFQKGDSLVNFQSLSDGHIRNLLEKKLVLNVNEPLLTDYYPIDSMSVVNGATTAVATSNSDLTNTNIYISYETDTGYVTTNLENDYGSGDLFLDSLTITPANSRYGNVIFIESFKQVDDTLFNYTNSCVVYEYPK